MKVRTAVITAAGPGQRRLPLQTFVDRDGVEKTALQILAEEVLAAGVEGVGVVVAPGDQEAFGQAAGPCADRLVFLEQPRPRGYGDAVARARDFTAGEAFLHLVGDHLYLSRAGPRCAQQVCECARAEGCAVSAVQATREAMLPYYGAVGGRRVPRRQDLYEIDTVLEKPTPSEAEQRLLVPGLRAGHYLCFFGIHVFTPALLELLAEAAGTGDDVPLSPALDRLALRERYLALEVRGERHNTGVKYGLLFAQLALALAGADRDEVLVQLVETLARRGAAHGGPAA
jgi:UTP--glucose-1-phosphate uridylyltransferase